MKKTYFESYLQPIRIVSNVEIRVRQVTNLKCLLSFVNFLRG